MISKLSALVIIFFLVNNSSFLIPNSFARTTPEDILNAQKETYNLRLKNYSSESQKKLDLFNHKITLFNQEKTEILSQGMEQQGLILEEYIRRTGADPAYQTDGIRRNLSNDIENARYWLTYAHEAVAYQAAKFYIFNLTSEKNVNSDILNTISNMQSDLNILKGKVIKSQNIIGGLIK